MSRRRIRRQGSEIRKRRLRSRVVRIRDHGCRIPTTIARRPNESNRHEADEEHERCPEDADAGGADDGRVHQGSERDGGSGARLAQRVPEQEFLDAARHEHVVDAVADEDASSTQSASASRSRGVPRHQPEPQDHRRDVVALRRAAGEVAHVGEQRLEQRLRFQRRGSSRTHVEDARLAVLLAARPTALRTRRR